ncbi:acyl-CoA carboxylase epsilon subunit [Streptomyces sp. CBMA152]|uniref:acyl-CoA carboxylase epsilon subunit n=1 Tax=Streptomyces sp. CBMA152 TaxID=1896312 RepID=UPI0037DA062C
MLHGNPNDEELALLVLVLRGMALNRAAVPNRPGTTTAGWGETQQVGHWSAGSWRVRSRGMERGSRRA